MCVSMDTKKLRERLREILRKERIIKDPFGKIQKKEKPIKNELTSAGRPILEQKRTLRIPGLRGFKRILSGFLFVNFLCLIWGMMTSYAPGPANDYILWIFVLGAWICLDYIWKTRREKETEAFE